MSKELKFSGKFNEVADSLNGVVLCGENGGPCPLVDIKIGTDSKDPTIPVYEFTLQVSSWKRLSEGDTAEPMETRNLSSIWSLKGQNQEINLRTLNDGLGLTGTALAIKDDDEDHMRLVLADEPGSLVNLIGKVTKGLYLKPTPQLKGDNELKIIYYNLYAAPIRVSAKAGGIKKADLLKMLKRDEAGF